MYVLLYCAIPAKTSHKSFQFAIVKKPCYVKIGKAF